MTTGAKAASAPAPDFQDGDGRLSDFYTWIGVRAVLGAIPAFANRVVVIGQSRGAGAACAAAGFAPTYAPDLDIRGGVATGLLYITPGMIGQTITATDQPNRTVAYNLFVALMMLQVVPNQTATNLLTLREIPALDAACRSCIGPLFHVVTDARLNRGNALIEGYRAAFTAVLPDLEYPTLELRFPIFIGTGERDHDIAPSRQKRLIREACAAGSIIEAHL